jgi:hypothetical protein
VRGTNFVPNGAQVYLWIQSRHPTIAGKYVDYLYKAAPCTAAPGKNPGPVVPGWEGATKASSVTLGTDGVTASHGPFVSSGGVRGNLPLFGKRYWESRHVAGDITRTFVFGICNQNYAPSTRAPAMVADTVDGWGFLCNQAKKRHGPSDVAWGSVFAPGDLHPVESNNTGNASWVWRAYFGGSAFEHSPPEGFSGL